MTAVYYATGQTSTVCRRTAALGGGWQVEPILEQLRRLAAEHNLAALVASSPENVTYTLGTPVPTQTLIRHRHVHVLIPVVGDPVAICVTIEEEQVRRYGRIADVRAYNEFTQAPADLLADAMAERGLDLEAVGLETRYVPVSDYHRLARRMPDAKWVDAKPVFDAARAIKTPEELAVIAAAAQAAEGAIATAFAQLQPGQTERDLARLLAGRYLELGGEKLHILVVATGERSSMLNASATDRVLRRGDVIRVDMIGTRQGYFSDVCRTAVVGPPDAEQKAIWSTIQQARELVLGQIRPGADTRAIYQSYQEFVASSGLLPINFVGHGLGLGLHEEPAIGRYGGTVLEPGMVLCVEPIHVVPGRMGFQLEDELLVTQRGYELLSGRESGPELPVIGV